MQNVQALHEVKRAEAEVRQLKEQAARQANDILRDAERKAMEFIERAKVEADAAQRDAVKRVLEDTSRDRQKTLKSAEADANALLSKLSGPEMNKAVDLVLRNFDARVAGNK